MSRPIDYVFLHGGGQAGWVWQETIAALHQQTSGRFGRALALDAPGCGEKRTRDIAGITVDDVVTELLADISDHGFKDIMLVGHSQAGTILPRLVERRRDLFQRLVFVASIAPAPAPGQTIIQHMGVGLHGSNKDEVGWPVDPKTVAANDRYSMMFCNDMNQAEAETFIAKLGRDTWPAQTMTTSDWRYAHLSSVPSIYVGCLDDGILPVPWQQTFSAR